MKRIVPNTYTSLDAVGIPASGIGKASVEETRKVTVRNLDLTAGPYKVRRIKLSCECGYKRTQEEVDHVGPYFCPKCSKVLSEDYLPVKIRALDKNPSL